MILRNRLIVAHIVAAGFVMLMAAGCQLNDASVQIPTAMVLPSNTPTATMTPAVTATPLATDTPETVTPAISYTPTATITDTATPTATFTSTLTPTVTLTPTPLGDATVTGENGANLRSGPSTSYSPALQLLEPGTQLLIAGRTEDGQWYEVRTLFGLSGWVYADLVTTRIDTSTLATTWVEPTQTPVIVVAAPSGGGPITGAIVSSIVTERVRQIFRDGQQRGNRNNAFAKVGDSITANQLFFVGLDQGDYALGSYDYLQDTVNFFQGSFGRGSSAADSAFDAASVLSAVWADPAVCIANETPLDCEYRIQRPSIAIIMLGSIDVQRYGADQYRNYMNIIVQITISQGIIPVLTTFPNGPNYYPSESETFNSIIREIAAREQIPLVELRNPALNMPSSGVMLDQFHLSQRGDAHISFLGDQNQYALTLRALLTLQVLHDLRVGLMS